ncbi:MAG TPA: hypothetical protein VMV10_24400 [Pirellulales bacterium]|nr:hypothetical protein [Pirellulales bacterium]
MSLRNCHLLLALLVAGLVGVVASEASAAPPNPFEPNDSFVVTHSGAPLMRGDSMLASLPQGITLKVLKVEGSWVGTAVMVKGQKVGGWVWAGQAATPEQYTAMQRSARRRYSFAPTPSYSEYGGYRTAPSYYGGTEGVLPNQESPNRLEIGVTPYGRRYWRADRKVMGY